MSHNYIEIKSPGCQVISIYAHLFSPYHNTRNVLVLWAMRQWESKWNVLLISGYDEITETGFILPLKMTKKMDLIYKIFFHTLDNRHQKANKWAEPTYSHWLSAWRDIPHLKASGGPYPELDGFPELRRLRSWVGWDK